MKNLLFSGAFILCSTVLFSCTTNESESQEKNAVKKTITPSTTSYTKGPGDQTIPVPPPKKPK